MKHLADYLEATAARFPDDTAVVDSKGGSITYAELNRQADALAAYLAAAGVAPGDRVGIVLPKSIPAVVSLFGIMKAGAVYVPADYTAPPERARRILSDCGIRVLIADGRCLSFVPETGEGNAGPTAIVLVGEPMEDRAADTRAIAWEAALDATPKSVAVVRSGADLAYILYTSGSTGMPKGVMISHENATSFVDWSSSVFAPTQTDRFSSHAPFHFDLSIFDVYVAIKHGATIYLIPDDLGKSPKELARYIADHRLTVWYSTPSILTLLLQFGNLPSHDVSSLRLVLFAGEVFPIKHLRELRRQWPAPEYYNLYGPTETNVCTFARIPARIPDDRDTPYPIGFPCSHCDAIVLDDEGREVQAGDEGLLYISGPSVFSGYWNRPADNASAFRERGNVRWYNTGDVVRWDPEHGFVYLGRKDRMVKRRGYRIELGEIERALYSHPALREAAVIAIADSDAGVKIVAYVSCSEKEKPPSIVDLKTFCSSRIPAYMIPDLFKFSDRLPRTSTDKVDYQALNAR